MGTPPRDPSPRPTRVRLGVLAFLCSLALLTYLDRACVMRVREPMQTELRLDDVQMGWVFSAFFYGYALLEMPAGWAGDRRGARRVLVRIVLWWSTFTALTGCVSYFTPPESFNLSAYGYPLVSTFGLLALVRFLFGAGEAGAFPNAARVTGVWFPPRERGTAQGAVWMFARLGGAVAPPVTGFLADALGWRRAFWALGCLGLAWAVAFFLWFRDRPEEMPACNEAERERIRAGRPAGTAPAAHDWPPLRLLLTSMSALAMCLAAFAVCFLWSFYITWQPKYYEDAFGMKAGESQWLTGLPYLCGATGALTGGWLSDYLVRRTGSRRRGRAAVGMAGFCGAGLCVLATCLATQPWQAATLLCLAFFINDLAIPTIWAASADIGGRFVGTLSGMMNMVGNIGAAISPVLIPVVLRKLEFLPAAVRWEYVFAGMAASWFVAAAAWLFIDAGTPLVPGD